MKKALLVAFVIVLIALGTLLVAPVFVDWNRYRPDVAATIARATGRDVTIAGDLELSFLPLPRLTVSRVGVASIPGAVEPEMLRIGQLRLELALAPLMAGRVAVRSLSLVDTTLILESTSDGRTNWTFAPAEEEAVPDRLAAGFSVDSISVTNGRLAWRTAGSGRRQLEAVHAIITIDRATGSSHVRSRATFEGIPFQLAASVGRFGRDGMAAVSSTVDIAGGTATLAATGRVRSDLRSASGSVQLTAADADRLGTVLTAGAAPAMPGWEIAADSPFSYGQGTVALHDIVVTYGEIRGTGRARLSPGTVPALNAELVVGTMKVDDVLAAVRHATPARGQSRTPDPATGMTGAFGKFTADLELSVRAARWRGGVIRNIGTTVHLGSEGMVVERLAMTLPGGTDVTLSASPKPGETGPEWEGDLAVISDNLRGALTWAGTKADDLPPDRLRNFSFTSRIALTPDSVHLSNIAAKLDATRMVGAATIARRTRPSFGIRLDLDQLELDAYLPGWMQGDRATERNRKGSIPGADRFDANLSVSVGRLTAGGRVASGVVFDARLFDGDVLLRNLSVGDLGGGTLTVSGTVDRVTDLPSGDLEIALDVADAERFAGFSQVAPTTIASRVGRFRLAAHLAGTARKAAVTGTLDIAGGKLTAEGHVTDADGAADFDVTVSGGHPDGDHVLNLFAPGRVSGGIGAMELTFAASRAADILTIRNLDATLGDMNIGGRIDVAYRGERPRATAVLSAGRLDLDRLWPARAETSRDPAVPAHRGSARWSRATFDLSALHNLDLDLVASADTAVRDKIRIDQLEFRSTLTDAVLTVDRLNGRLFGGDLEVSGRIDAAASLPEFVASISGRDMAARPALAAIAGFDRVEGPMSFSASLSAVGQNPFDLVSSLSGRAAISGQLRGRRRGDKPLPFGVAGDAAVLLLDAFADSTAALSGAVRLENGAVRTDDLSLDGDGVRAVTVGAIDLSGWRIDTTTTLRRDQDEDGPANLLVELRGTLDDPAVRLAGPAVDGDEDTAPVPNAAPVIPVEPVAPTPADLQASP